jgi:hypothetical protein
MVDGFARHGGDIGSRMPFAMVWRMTSRCVSSITNIPSVPVNSIQVPE